jgi:DNA polymerase (family 10)
MNNKEIAQVFFNIACFLEMKKDNIFKIRAYQKVARSIEQLTEELETVVQQGKLREIPGIGEAIEKKIIEMLNTGELAFFEKLKTEFPAEIAILISVPGINPKTAGLLLNEYGIKTINDLAGFTLSGKLARIPGIDDNTSAAAKRYFLQEREKDVFQPKPG